MTTSTLAVTSVLAYDKMPEEVMGPIRTMGGWFVFLVNFFAILHLIFLGASIAFEKVKHHPMAGITSGEWFTKIMLGVYVTAAAGDIAAAVLFAT